MSLSSFSHVKILKILILREFDDTLRDLNDDIDSNFDKQNKYFSN